MAETSPGWNVDYNILPGEKVVRGVMRSVKKILTYLPPSEGYPSERRQIVDNSGAAPFIDAHMDQAPQLPFPGEVGGVEVIDFRAAASDY